MREEALIHLACLLLSRQDFFLYQPSADMKSKVTFSSSRPGMYFNDKEKSAMSAYFVFIVNTTVIIFLYLLESFVKSSSN